MSYRLLTLFLWPAIFLYTLKIAWRHRSLNYFKQRLGFAYPSFKQPPLWIHCASVGESNTALPLLKELIAAYPQQVFLFTTNTPTGAFIVKKNASPNTEHCYLPIESSGAIKRFLKQTQPRLALILETEIWPLLYQQCTSTHVPISMINARLSHKTTNTGPWISKLYRQALQQVDHILCRSSQDQQLFLQLGASEQQTETIGNLKFAAPASKTTKAVDHFTERAFILVASTHDDEERQIARLWKSLQPQPHLLVIAPRHPERTTSILEQLNPLGLNIAVRSQQQNINSDTELYLADTIGELTGFMQQADLVIMGGSFIRHGGQNLLEPARLQKAIIIGPYMYNFQAEVEQFLDNEACIQVEDIDELGQQIQTLISDDAHRQQLGSRAKQLMSKEEDIAQRYAEKIIAYYDDQLR